MRRLLYVCLDGLGDEPHPNLDGRTPLEAARTPFLDALARRGRQGLVHTVGRDIAPESDIAVFAILGYDPREEHPGRGVLEAIGSGMEFRDGDLAHRVNFATVEGARIVDRRVGRDLPSDDARALADEVNDRVSLPGATFELRATVEHRGALVIRPDEGRLSAAISNTDPAYAKQGSLGVALETFEDRVAWSEPLEETDAARRAADLTNAFVRESAKVLAAAPVNGRRSHEGRLPANLILTRDAGDHVPDLQPIRDRFGPSWGCFVEMPVERGIALLLGMGEVPAPSTPDPARRYAAWAGLAAEALDGFDALYVHIKGPDVPAHDGRAEDKRDVIEVIDASFFGELLPAIDAAGTVVAVTADHATSCIRKAHTSDAVPLLVAGGSVTADGTESFGERAARDGSLGTVRGVEILPRLVGLLRD
ncbi:MAG TPA: 2,3-bisphosphoglycerate-independent phosphoglycerate mutase [Actinomycetota bacterium]|nr:2,3-bisphosphoglycerate-independent phosphoglycerate mutase [Actinomycetota bacterium]